MIKIVYYRTLFSQSAASLTAGYLAGYLRKYTIEVGLELLEIGRLDNLQKVLKNSDECQVIIYKCNFQDYIEGFNLMRAIKEVCPDKKIYVMGYFAEINAHRIMSQNKFINGVVYGDGCDFARIYDESNGERTVGGLFRKNETLYEDRNSRYIPLSELPRPARDIEKKEQGQYINLIWRNGCYGSCSFCHINLVNRPFSERKIEDVVEEIEECYYKLGKRMFIFNDSVFWWGEKDDESLNRFVSLVKAKKLDISFMIYLRCTPFIGEERLAILKEVGLQRVFIGIENVSESFYSEYNKNVVKYDKILEIFEKMHISYHIGFILFHPRVTVKELGDNIRYLYKLKKLYRLGIIIEKMRIMRVGNDSLYQDKIDIAYEYEFDNPEIDFIYSTLKDFFAIFNIRDFENVCTSTLYLMNIYGNRFGDWEAEVFTNFKNLIKAFNDFSNNFYEEVLVNYNNYRCTEEFCNILKDKYLDSFQRYYYRFQAMKGLVYDYISQRDSTLHLQVFHGQRRINAYD